MDQAKITDCIETLCLKGCKEVALLIRAIEHNDLPQEMAALDAEEREAVLAELKSIMAVYQEGSKCGLI